VRFVDFLKTTVLLNAAAATTLATLDVLAAAGGSRLRTVWVTAAWWVVAAAIGLWVSRRGEVSPGIARLLASARASTTLPEQRPGRALMNRLWPILLLTVVAGALAVLSPAIPGIAGGFAIVFTVGWRRQHSAVAAVEHRDGVTFYVERTSPLHAISLLRVPGVKALHPEQANGALR
jgi:hypothetical protein